MKSNAQEVKEGVFLPKKVVKEVTTLESVESLFNLYQVPELTGQNVTDKMVWTKCHGQNGSNFYRFQLN